MKNFKETYANKSTAISKLIFLESRFLYAVFNKDLNKTNKKQEKKKNTRTKFLKVSYCVTDQRKPKLYPIGCFQNSILNGIWLTKKKQYQDYVFLLYSSKLYFLLYTIHILLQTMKFKQYSIGWAIYYLL